MKLERSIRTFCGAVNLSLPLIYTSSNRIFRIACNIPVPSITSPDIQFITDGLRACDTDDFFLMIFFLTLSPGKTIVYKRQIKAGLK
jgi:hypothetical protein